MVCTRKNVPLLPILVLLALWILQSCGAEPPEDTTPKPYTCAGAPATCLRFGSGWTYEGVVMPHDLTVPDPWLVRLDDGRIRLYCGVSIDEGENWNGIVSWISDDGLQFTEEPGFRLQGYSLFQFCVVRNPDATWRMYWLDQKQGQVNGRGNKAIKSAVSVDGAWTFTEEAGERLTYSGTGYEVNGIWSGKVIALPGGGFRMYYTGIGADHGRSLSAFSSNGLDFAREDGVRLDVMCPPEESPGNVTPIIDAQGTYHTFTRAVRCTGDYVGAVSGLFDGPTVDGLTLSIAASPYVRGYSKDGTLSNQVDPQDFCPVQTPQGLRVYFILYNSGSSSQIIPETALYSVINMSIR
ncbi:MAG: hypothetical protein KA243_10580 [Candidatus Aminicenantes bacterium]|nr:hypothetical protein [Candidatus Aminicenantes bacterium]NLH76500.1 hypothetical protein [Acidobacteriota bacterium]